MLQTEEVSALYCALQQDDLPENPISRLILATERADLCFRDVFEHLIIQTLSELPGKGNWVHNTNGQSGSTYANHS